MSCFLMPTMPIGDETLSRYYINTRFSAIYFALTQWIGFGNFHVFKSENGRDKNYLRAGFESYFRFFWVLGISAAIAIILLALSVNEEMLRFLSSIKLRVFSTYSKMSWISTYAIDSLDYMINKNVLVIIFIVDQCTFSLSSYILTSNGVLIVGVDWAGELPIDNIVVPWSLFYD